MTQLEQSEQEWLNNTSRRKRKTPTKSAFPENISNKNVNFLEINTKILHTNNQKKKVFQITTHGIWLVKKKRMYLKAKETFV